jgi:hypothetical protein
MHATATTALPRATHTNVAPLQLSTTFVWMARARKISFGLFVLFVYWILLKQSEMHLFASWAT